MMVTGALTGLVNGFFGGGGGMALVPLLRGWLEMEDKNAFATSVAVMLPLCAVSAAVYHFKVGIGFGAALPYLIGGLIGGIVSGISFRRLPQKLLVRAFALLILFGGVRSVMG